MKNSFVAKFSILIFRSKRRTFSRIGVQIDWCCFQVVWTLPLTVTSSIICMVPVARCCASGINGALLFQVLETTIENPEASDMKILHHVQHEMVPSLGLYILDSHVEGTMDKICNGTLPMCKPSSVFDVKISSLKLHYRYSRPRLMRMFFSSRFFQIVDGFFPESRRCFALKNRHFLEFSVWIVQGTFELFLGHCVSLCQFRSSNFVWSRKFSVKAVLLIDGWVGIPTQMHHASPDLSSNVVPSDAFPQNSIYFNTSLDFVQQRLKTGKFRGIKRSCAQ